MNKLGNVEYEILFEHLHNIIFLSKKGRKSPVIISNFCGVLNESFVSVSEKEISLIRKLFSEEIVDFLSLNYPTNYFKASIVLNIYPIPLATIVVLMVYQRISRFLLKNSILLAFFLIILFLLVLMVLDFFLNRKIKSSRLYISSKSHVHDHSNTSFMSDKMEGHRRSALGLSADEKQQKWKKTGD